MYWELDLITTFGHWEQSPSLSPDRLFGQQVGFRRDCGEFEKNLNFLIGCLVTVCIGLPQKSCSNKISLPQTLSWRQKCSSKSLRTLGTSEYTGNGMG